jgi:predicted permease
MIGDFAFTFRALARRPAFLLLSVATLAVGIGSATTVFSVTEAVLLRDPPLPEADRLAGVYSTNPAIGMDAFSVSYPDFVDWTGRDDLFSDASIYALFERDLSGEGDPERLLVARVHRRFFETLGTSAAMGRLLGDEEQDPAAERTIVLSHDLWVRRFGADPDVIGRTLRLDAEPHTVIGVAAEGQSWPSGTDLWLPLQYGSDPPESVARRSNHRWQVVARLQPGVDVGVASTQVRAMARSWYAANEAGNERTTEATVVPLRATGPAGEAAVGLAIVGAAVFLVLLIACLNQANLLLVNAWARARELSLRSALGAGRARLVTLLLGESLILALAGVALGLGLAWLGLRGIEAMAPQGGARDLDARINGLVLSAALGTAVLASLLAGLVPALRASRTSVAAALGEGGAATGVGRSGARLRRSLVVLEMTLSVVLLTGAGITIRTFQTHIDTDAGLDASGVLIFNVRLPGARYPDDAARQQYYDGAVERLEGVPGVRVASATSSLPLGASRYNLYRVFLLEGAPEPPAGPDYGALWIEVDPRYFETLRIGPVRGRAFTEDDGPGSPPVIIVNESMARRMSPDEEIVGRSIRSWRDEDLLREVVGVVPDFQLNALSGWDQPAVLVPRAQGEYVALSFMVRSAGDPAGIVRGVRSVMQDLDPDVALQGMRTLAEAHHEGLAAIRTVTMIFGVFGALALALAVSGVYGLVATSVAQRTREIGIRMALGGTPMGVGGHILAESARLATIGVLGGLVLALGLARVLSGAIVGISWLDPRTIAGVTLLLAGAVLAATLVPALRATRVDPVRALKTE